MKQDKIISEAFPGGKKEEGRSEAYKKAAGRTAAEERRDAPVQGQAGAGAGQDAAKPEENRNGEEITREPELADTEKPKGFCQTEPESGGLSRSFSFPAPQKSPEEVEAELSAYLAGEDSREETGDKKGRKQKRAKKRRPGKIKADENGGGKAGGVWRTKKGKRRAAAAAAVLAAAIFIKAFTGGEKAVQAPSMLLTKGDVVSTLSLTGPVSGTESADVVSNLHAEVLEIRVKEGDRVEKGQVLAVIDRTDAQKEVDIAQNSYELAVSEYNENIRDTRNGYEKAVQDYNTAKLNYDRTKALFDAGASSQADFESAGNALSDARRAVDGFTVENGQAVPDKSYELKIKSAQFELEQKKRNLEDTEVKSPISGTVVRVNSKVGQFADKPEDEKPMFIVENLDQLNMELQISEYSVGKVSVGLPVEITADILDGKTASGTITSISPTGEEKAGGGSSERVVPTTVSIDDPSGALIAGITARATVVTEKAEHVFKVPTTAILNGEDGVKRIAVLSEGTKTVHLLPVTTGTESDLETEIAPAEGESLQEGMTVLLSPAGLEEGMEVEPV